MDKDKSSQMFFTLIYSFQMQAMIGLGKLNNPVTNKSEKDMDAASMAIDMLEMLQDKSRNNISKEEETFLNETLTNLRLNFLEEKNKTEQ